MMLRPWLLLAAGGLLVAAYGWGRWDGNRLCVARVEAAAAEARKVLARGEAARLELQAERDRLARDLEDQANADPVVVRECLGVDRVRRLNQR